MEQPKPEQFKTKKKPPVPLIVVAVTVCYIQGLMTGFGLLAGIQPRMSLLHGIWGYVLPFVVCFGCMYCLGSAWHYNVKFAAVTKSVRGMVIALLVSVVFTGFGVATSGRYLVAKIDGIGALREHELDYADRLDATLAASEDRASADRPVMNKLSGAGQGLRGTQENEKKYGPISGKPGAKGVYDTLGQEASLFDTRLHEAQVSDGRRTGYLNDARQALVEARGAADADDEAEYLRQVNAARAKIGEANKISLLDVTAGIGAGLVTDLARRPFEEAKREVDDFIASAREKQVGVDIPVFRKIDAEDAVLEHPPVMAWIMAVSIEAFPLMMVLLILIGRFEGLDPIKEAHPAE